MRYVALLRGINVGGRNKVPMAELREAFERAGHTDVSTYIQSGNVLFRSVMRAALGALNMSTRSCRFRLPPSRMLRAIDRSSTLWKQPKR